MTQAKMSALRTAAIADAARIAELEASLTCWTQQPPNPTQPARGEDIEK